MTTVLTETDEFALEADGLRLAPADVERITGWALKPEGMCRDELCVPWKSDAGRIDLAAFWQHIGQPAVSAGDGSVWALGSGADQRSASLAGLEAPDFALPDLDGKLHRLSEHRGRKVLLTTWASW